MKFAVLSLNPGIDRVLYLGSPMRPGEMNRASKSVTSQGSKGANVAIMLSRLGCDVEYYSFTGGIYGDVCESFIAAENENGKNRGKIIPRYVNAGCGVRVNTKVIDSEGVCTELNERGGIFTKDEADALTEAYLSSDADVFCMCGSIPQGVENYVYKSLIEELKSRGKVTVLDCDGEALRLGMEAKPGFIKPNLYELGVFLKSTGLWKSDLSEVEKSEEIISDACGKLHKNFGTEILCTLGSRGAVATGADGSFVCPPAKVTMRGFSGAGDCFLAGFLAAYFNDGKTLSEALAQASACGGAKVEIEGTLLPGRERVAGLALTVVPHRI